MIDKVPGIMIATKYYISSIHFTNVLVLTTILPEQSLFLFISSITSISSRPFLTILNRPCAIEFLIWSMVSAKFLGGMR